MKIAILRQNPWGAGGAETTLGYLARGFQTAGHEVAVFGAALAPLGADPLGPGIAYVPVPVWGGRSGRALSFAVNARRLLHRAHHQVVFSLERTFSPHVYRAGDGCHREWLARRAPYLAFPAGLSHRLSLFHAVMLFLERRLFTDPELRAVIANSRQVQEEIVRHYRVSQAKTRIIFNGLDHGVFRPLPVAAQGDVKLGLGGPAAARIILFVGSGFFRKGLGYLLEAFRSLNNQSLLWVVGKGPTRRYEMQAMRLGVAPRVKFWGDQREVAPLYQAATVLALPTLYDPCSNVVLEALGCGLPVLTTAANGAREFITAGVNGRVLERPDDAAAWGDALREFLERGSDLQVRRAAQEAVAHLSWEKTVAQTLEVLEEAANALPAH